MVLVEIRGSTRIDRAGYELLDSPEPTSPQ